MNKKIAAIALIIAMCLMTNIHKTQLIRVEGNSEIKVIVNGMPIQFDVPPQMLNNRVMIPMRTIFEALDAKIEWDGAAQRIYATTNKGDTVILTIGDNNAYVNNELFIIDTPPQIINGRTLVPTRFVAEALGANVTWDDSTKTVLINFVPVTSIRVTAERNIYEIGSQFVLTVEVFPEDATDKEFSLDINGASLSDPTTIICDKSGDVVITATANNGITSRELSVFVYDIPEFERRVLELVNIERKDRGLSTLTWDDKLADAARKHSEDSARNNMTGHVGSNGSTMGERIKKAGISYRVAAENCTYQRRTPEAAVESWMDSEGHRNNILNASLTRLGVGLHYMEDSQYGFYWTQKFTG